MIGDDNLFKSVSSETAQQLAAYREEQIKQKELREDKAKRDAEEAKKANELSEREWQLRARISRLNKEPSSTPARNKQRKDELQAAREELVSMQFNLKDKMGPTYSARRSKSSPWKVANQLQSSSTGSSEDEEEEEEEEEVLEEDEDLASSSQSKSSFAQDYYHSAWERLSSIDESMPTRSSGRVLPDDLKDKRTSKKGRSSSKRLDSKSTSRGSSRPNSKESSSHRASKGRSSSKGHNSKHGSSRKSSQRSKAHRDTNTEMRGDDLNSDSDSSSSSSSSSASSAAAEQKEAAAKRIQAVQRGKAARSRVAELKRNKPEERLAQQEDRFEELGEDVEEAEEAHDFEEIASRSEIVQQREAAARRIQAAQRGKSDRLRVAEMRQKKIETQEGRKYLDEAAVRIQSTYRGKAARSRVAEMRHVEDKWGSSKGRISSKAHNSKRGSRRSSRTKSKDTSGRNASKARSSSKRHNSKSNSTLNSRPNAKEGSSQDTSKAHESDSSSSSSSSSESSSDETGKREAAHEQRGNLAKSRRDTKDAPMTMTRTESYSARGKEYREKVARERAQMRIIAEEQRQVKLREKHRHDAAARIQSVQRGKKDRSMIPALKVQRRIEKQRHCAAVRIQAVQRGKAARAKAAELKTKQAMAKIRVDPKRLQRIEILGRTRFAYPTNREGATYAQRSAAAAPAAREDKASRPAWKWRPAPARPTSRPPSASQEQQPAAEAALHAVEMENVEVAEAAEQRMEDCPALVGTVLPAANIDEPSLMNRIKDSKAKPEWRKGRWLNSTSLNMQAETPEEIFDSLQRCASFGRWAEALWLLESLREQEQRLRVQDYAAAVAACGKASRWQTALDLLSTACSESAARDGSWEGNVFGSFVTPKPIYTAAVSACESAQQWAQVLRLLQEMRGISGDMPIGTYKAVARACEHGVVSMATATTKPRKREDSQVKVAPKPIVVSKQDVPTCRQAAVAFEQSRQWAEALNLLEEMKWQGLCPDLATYNACIGACALSQRWEAALTTLNHVRELQGIEADGDTYSAAFLACGNRWEAALALLRQLRQDGFQPSQADCGVLVGACNRGRHWQRALAVLEELQTSAGHTLEASGLASDDKAKTRSVGAAAYSHALRACETGSCWEVALRLLKEINNAKLPPHLHAYAAAEGACVRAGKKTRVELLHDQLCHADSDLVVEPTGSPSLSPGLCRAALALCEQRQQWKEALQIVQTAAQERLNLDAEHYSSAMTTCGKTLQWRQAIELVTLMKRKDLTPSTGAYSACIQALGAGKQWPQALFLFNQMRRCETSIDLRVYQAVLACCEIGLVAKAQEDSIPETNSVAPLGPDYMVRHAHRFSFDDLSDRVLLEDASEKKHLSNATDKENEEAAPRSNAKPWRF